jgi:hypothetical protein
MGLPLDGVAVVVTHCWSKKKRTRGGEEMKGEGEEGTKAK